MQLAASPLDAEKCYTQHKGQPSGGCSKCEILQPFFDVSFCGAKSLQGLELFQCPFSLTASSVWPLPVTPSLSHWPQRRKAKDESMQVSACLLLPITCFLWLYRVTRRTQRECENLMVRGNRAETGRELLWVSGSYIKFCCSAFTHTSLDCRIQPWCHLSLSSLSLWIPQAVEGGVCFSHDVKWEDLIR